jgi:hypothetical protein
MKATLLAMLILISWAQAQEDEEVAVRTRHINGISIQTHLAGRHFQVTVDLTIPIDARAIDFKAAILERRNFDRWVFGETVSETRPPMKCLEELLSAKIEVATLKHKLTDQQRKKIGLAGRGDIKRFFDRVEDGRNDFEGSRVGYDNGIKALLRLKPLSDEYNNGIFGDGSLLAKTLHRITEESEQVTSRVRAYKP